MLSVMQNFHKGLSFLGQVRIFVLSWVINLTKVGKTISSLDGLCFGMDTSGLDSLSETMF